MNVPQTQDALVLELIKQLIQKEKLDAPQNILKQSPANNHQGTMVKAVNNHESFQQVSQELQGIKDSLQELKDKPQPKPQGDNQATKEQYHQVAQELQLIKNSLQEIKNKPLATPQVTPQTGQDDYNKVNQELQGIKSSLQELKKVLQGISQQKPQPQVVQQSPIPSPPPQHHIANGNGQARIHQELVQDALLNAEYHMQNLAPGTFLAKGNFKEYYIWAGQTPNGILVVLLESQTHTITNNILNIIGGQIINEMPNDIKQVPRLFNKKAFDFYKKYKELEQKLFASFVLVDKKSAKVSFTGAGMNLFKIDKDKKIKGMKGLKAPLGVPNNQFDMHVVSIKRGETFYFSTRDKLPKTCLEINGESPIRKKERLNEWLQQQQKNSVILGLSF